ncbi:MAG: hypothetical protein CRN43_05935 [Candidatus Nephrothrix sp. EaCA]|nr:MAG: hypothetical protein CRN43_05935 [Candidatus Nephrothrix sp. EaCA]
MDAVDISRHKLTGIFQHAPRGRRRVIRQPRLEKFENYARFALPSQFPPLSSKKNRLRLVHYIINSCKFG